MRFMVRRFPTRASPGIREHISRDDINRLIGECRFGTQAMADEHFGMATAELARGGC